MEGKVVSDGERTANEAAQQQEEAAAEYLPLSPTFERELRMQLADITERAHQSRLNPGGYEPLGAGGGITAEVVRAMSEEIWAHSLPRPVDSEQDRTALRLFGALAAAAPSQHGARSSFVIVRDRLMLDVYADIGAEPPAIRFVRLPDRPASQDAAERDAAERDAAEQDTGGEGAADLDAAEQAAAEHDTAEHEPVGPREDDERPARYAAVICGSAAVIAGRRSFLSMDALMTYARRRAFAECGNAADPEAARRGMRVAHGIEIVVLLDMSLGGGVWADVDPATGRAAATMSIDLTQDGFAFLPLHAA
jgi:hypothetical protein